jgi:hypothetical protein
MQIAREVCGRLERPSAPFEHLHFLELPVPIHHGGHQGLCQDSFTTERYNSSGSFVKQNLTFVGSLVSKLSQINMTSPPAVPQAGSILLILG